MDIVVWLRSLGLEEYEEAFRDNKITSGSSRASPPRTSKSLALPHSGTAVSCSMP
jgi:SAM domain (Sterile alpha motif)